MELLQGLNLQMSVLLDTSQSLYGSLCCCHVGEVRNLRLYSCLTDLAVIASALLIVRGIDDDCHFSVGNLI